jgi:curved DNA-binding protein CbpA
MTAQTTYYDILGVPGDSPPEHIKSSFHKLAIRHHPDKNGNSPESQVKYLLISNAYGTLIDPVKRKEYDDYLGRSPGYSRQGKPRRPSREALPGKAGEIYRTDRELLDHFNFLLWDLEDLIRNNNENVKHSGPFTGCMMKILAFIDKWVLEPAGYPDYFMEARKLKKMDPAEYAASINQQKRVPGHRPFVNLRDYFYDIRRRMDRFLENTAAGKLVAPIPGCGPRLIDCIIEAQNHTLHYLGILLKMKTAETGEIKPFIHSQDCFEK